MTESVDLCPAHGEPECPCVLFTICPTCLRFESDPACHCAEEREHLLAELDDEMQSEVDSDAEYDRRNADRSCDYEPRSAF